MNAVIISHKLAVKHQVHDIYVSLLWDDTNIATINVTRHCCYQCHIVSRAFCQSVHNCSCDLVHTALTE